MKILYSIRAVFICSIVTGNIKIVLVFLLLFFYGVATLLAKDGDNVILIVIDSLQSSHLRCYGYNKETSPNIDSLAKQGTMFKDAIAQSSWTCSSMPSILTGTYPRTHRRYDWNHLVNPDKKTIMDVLRENGYYNIGFTVGSYGLDLNKTFDAHFDSSLIKADSLTSKVIDWLNVNKEKKFFMLVHYMDIHGPYEPPYPYNEFFLPERYKGLEPKSNEVVEALFEDFREILKEELLKPNLNTNDINSALGRAFYSIREFFISQYDGELSFVDAELGVLFRRIKELGLDSKTMIIITADHGEHFGDNENADKDFIFEHGNSLFDIELKVPLIIKSNSDFIAKKKVLKEQVELIDVYPTILDYLEIKNTNSIEGISLLPGILGKEFQVKKYAFSELFRLAEEEGDTGQYFISVRTTRWKLISLEDLCNRSFCNNSNPKYYFFDIKNDPKEFNNLSGSRNQNFDVLKNELLEFINKSGSRKKPKSSYISNEEKQTLKNLGYLQ